MGTSCDDRPVVALHADGSRGVGLGHVRRCVALAVALAPSACPILLMRGDPDLVTFIRAAGLACHAIGEDDLIGGVRALRADGLVVDTYRLQRPQLVGIRAEVRCLVVVDDTGRFPLPADLVVNPTAGLEPPADDGHRYLLGPRVALLGPEFAEAPTRTWPPSVRDVLVTLGGMTRAPLTARLAAAARRSLPTATLHVVVGPAGDSVDDVAAALDVGGAVLHRAPPRLRQLMLAADLAISAGGVTLLELAATATPTVGLSLAANQRANLAGLEHEGAVRWIGDAEDVALESALEAALRDLASAPARRVLGTTARRVVDGQGAARVARKMLELLAADAPSKERAQC